MQYSEEFVVDIDGLAIGVHVITITFHPYFGDITRTFTIRVLETNTSPTTTTANLVMPLMIGTSIIGASVVIVIIYTMYQKRVERFRTN